MDTVPLVSIIVNNFNYGRFLGCAIESALAQTYASVEVIVVDDGSTDSSHAVIRSFGTRVRPLIKDNGGQGSAFNAGFRESYGELILFLDSDDLLEPEAVELVVRAWAQDMSKLHFPLHSIDEQGILLGRRFPREQLAVGNVVSSLLTEGDYCTSPTSGNVFSREFLRSVMPIPEEEWRTCADCYLVQSAPFYGQIGRLSRIVGRYRIHSTSLTSNVQAGSLRLNALHMHLKLGLRKQRLLNEVANRSGLHMRQNAVVDTQNYCKLRLISLKLSSATHPIDGDRLLSALARLLVLTIKQREQNCMRRGAYLIWAPLIALLPVSIVEPLAILALPNGSTKVRALFATARAYGTRTLRGAFDILVGSYRH